MMPHESQISHEDVLYAFAVEPNSGRDTLEQYLRDYPQYVAELVDLSYELSREVCEDETPLSDRDLATIDRAWKRHTEAIPKATVALFTNLSVADQRDLARHLGVPRQVIMAFRERQIKPASVPTPFLERLASALNSTVESLRDALSLPPAPNLAQSYKADDRPEAREPVTFE
jgi:hypothetical protein